MGYENVDPSTLQTLLGSPPVAVSGGAAVATSGFGTMQSNTDFSAPDASDAAVVYGAEDPQGPPPSYFTALMRSLTQNLTSLDFNSAVFDLREIQHHLNMGYDHWRRFVEGMVS